MVNIRVNQTTRENMLHLTSPSPGEGVRHKDALPRTTAETREPAFLGVTRTTRLLPPTILCTTGVIHEGGVTHEGGLIHDGSATREGTEGYTGRTSWLRTVTDGSTNGISRMITHV